MALGAMVGQGGTDILDGGIFTSEGDALQLPITANTNVDMVTVGDDKATAFGMGDGFPFGPRNGPATAQNNLEIKKNQQSGNSSPGANVGLKVNIENIEVGNRAALAFGSASATNNIKIVTNQVWRDKAILAQERYRSFFPLMPQLGNISFLAVA